MILGRKINFRPLFVSFLIGLIVFGLCRAVFSFSSFSNFLDILFSLIIGIAFFLLIFVGYYYLNLSKMYTYVEVDKKGIKYTDMDSSSNKYKMMFFPMSNSLKTIDTNEIKSLYLFSLGKRPQISNEILAGPSYAIFSSNTLMASNPTILKVTLKDDKKISIDLSRAAIEDYDKFMEKINDMSEILNIPVGQKDPNYNNKAILN